MRLRFTAEQFFLLLALVIVSSLMAGQMWGTAFTCDDDFYAATAWQRAGGDVHGWSAVWSVSWNACLYTGRFYQLFLYTLWQMPYLLGSFEMVNAIRIGTMLFTFASLCRDARKRHPQSSLGPLLLDPLRRPDRGEVQLQPISLLPAVVQFGTRDFVCSHPALSRGDGAREILVGSRCCGHILRIIALLRANPLLCVVFFALAYAHNSSLQRSRIAAAARAFANVWPIGASAVLYLMLYAGFKYWHPGGYAGTELSLASFKEVARTIVGFSLSGLNFQGILHMNRQWSAVSMLAALLVLPAAFLSMRRLARDAAPNRLLPLAGIGAVCMLLPNILYGFSGRYRHWLANIDNFYLGSFYSSFAEAVVIATISILIVRVAARLRVALAIAVVVAVFLGMATYSNVSQTVTFFQVHRENRKIWDLVEAKTASPRPADRVRPRSWSRPP